MRWLLLLSALTSFLFSLSMILPTEIALPVAICTRRASNGYLGVDAIVASPWYTSTQIHKLAEEDESATTIDRAHADIITVIGGLSMFLVTLGGLIFIMETGSVPSFFVVITSLAAMVHSSLIIAISPLIECRATGATLLAGVQFIFWLIVICCGRTAERRIDEYMKKILPSSNLHF